METMTEKQAIDSLEILVAEGYLSKVA